jgi:hypothetical protein
MKPAPTVRCLDARLQNIRLNRLLLLEVLRLKRLQD